MRPFTFLVSDPLLTPYCISQCGQPTYIVKENYPFVALTPPISGNLYTDDFTLKTETADLLQIGTHTATVTASLSLFPVVTASVTFQITFTHPCPTTKLIPYTIADMTYQMTI